MKNKIILSVVLFGLFFSGCSDQGIESKSNVSTNIRGEWKSERTYANEYFDIQITIPDSWHLSKGQQQYIQDSASDFLAGDDENFKSMLKSAIEKTFNPFYAYRHPPGTPGKTNPNVCIVIENVKNLPGITSGSDYLRAIEDTLKMSNKDYIFDDQPRSVKLADAEYYKRISKLPMGTIEITQEFYAQKKGDYILLIGTNLISGVDDETVREAMSTIKNTKG